MCELRVSNGIQENQYYRYITSPSHVFTTKQKDDDDGAFVYMFFYKALFSYKKGLLPSETILTRNDGICKLHCFAYLKVLRITFMLSIHENQMKNECKIK